MSMRLLFYAPLLVFGLAVPGVTAAAEHPVGFQVPTTVQIAPDPIVALPTATSANTATGSSR